jgi:hypothetical protein
VPSHPTRVKFLLCLDPARWRAGPLAPQSHFAVPTMEGMALGPSPVLPFRHDGDEETGRERLLGEGEALYGFLGAGMTTFATGRRREERQARYRTVPGQADPQGGRGKAPGRSPECLRSKPECGFVSRGSCSRLHLRSRIQRVRRRRAHPLERGAAAPMGCGWGRPRRGLKRKPESVRKQEGNRNVITLSRFLWPEQWGPTALPPTAAQPLGAMDSEEESILGRGMSPTVSRFAPLRPSNVETPGHG